MASRTTRFICKVRLVSVNYNMEISFGDSKLQKLCEQQDLAQRKLGANCAKKLKSRLADLAAVNSVRVVNVSCLNQLITLSL